MPHRATEWAAGLEEQKPAAVQVCPVGASLLYQSKAQHWQSPVGQGRAVAVCASTTWMQSSLSLPAGHHRPVLQQPDRCWEAAAARQP